MSTIKVLKYTPEELISVYKPSPVPDFDFGPVISTQPFAPLPIKKENKNIKSSAMDFPRKTSNPAYITTNLNEEEISTPTAKENKRDENPDVQWNPQPVNKEAYEEEEEEEEEENDGPEVVSFRSVLDENFTKGMNSQNMSNKLPNPPPVNPSIPQQQANYFFPQPPYNGFYPNSPQAQLFREFMAFNAMQKQNLMQAQMYQQMQQNINMNQQNMNINQQNHNINQLNFNMNQQDIMQKMQQQQQMLQQAQMLQQFQQMNFLRQQFLQQRFMQNQQPTYAYQQPQNYVNSQPPEDDYEEEDNYEEEENFDEEDNYDENEADSNHGNDISDDSQKEEDNYDSNEEYDNDQKVTTNNENTSNNSVSEEAVMVPSTTFAPQKYQVGDPRYTTYTEMSFTNQTSKEKRNYHGKYAPYIPRK